MKEGRLEVELRIWNVDSTFAEALGRIPGARQWSAGDLRAPSSKLRFDESGWGLASSVSPKSDLGQHLADIIERVHEQWPLVVDAALAGEAELSVVVHVGLSRTPYLGLSRDDLRVLAELACFIDFDLYHSVDGRPTGSG